MSNIDAVNALITAINFDRFPEIGARHQPDATFISFRGPNLRDSVAISDWHRTFARDYADTNYTDLEYIEDNDVVAVRATIEAKGYDWRPFSQRVVEVFRVADDAVAERRLYGMLRDVELSKPATQAMEAAQEAGGGSASATRSLVTKLYAGLLAHDEEDVKAALDPKCALVDSVYGIVAGPDAVLDLTARIPSPAFGIWRVTNVFAGPKDAVVELSIDPSRPRRADWVRIVDGKVRVIETYWMLREIGIPGDQNYAHERHIKQVIMPV